VKLICQRYHSIITVGEVVYSYWHIS